MNIQENILLKDHTTLRTGGPARFFAVAKTATDLRELFAFSKSRKLPILVLGGGSNLLIADHGYNGLVIKNEIKGIKFTDRSPERVALEVGAGEIWDEVVALSVIRNLSGLENLSGIPGTVGGAVVQNAGAYGAEVKDVMVSVHGFNLVNGKEFSFKVADCQYGYRESIFKKNKKFIIISVTMELNKRLDLNLNYAALEDRLKDEKEITVQKIRDIILEIRSEKLPDWKKTGTAGSFYKNPVITEGKFADLKRQYPDLPGFPGKAGDIKVSLAWILDRICGLKGYKQGNVRLYDKQPLVLVNSGTATEKEISDFSEKIKKIVKEKTGIEIEMEVEIIK